MLHFLFLSLCSLDWGCADCLINSDIGVCKTTWLKLIFLLAPFLFVFVFYHFFFQFVQRIVEGYVKNVYVRRIYS